MSTIRTSWLVPHAPCSTQFCMWIYNQPPISLCLQAHASSTVGQLSQLAVRITCLWNTPRRKMSVPSSYAIPHSPLPSCTNHPFPITEQHVNLAAADKFRTYPACASLSLSVSPTLLRLSLNTIAHFKTCMSSSSDSHRMPLCHPSLHKVLKY